jgi:molecular chaperone GrpE
MSEPRETAPVEGAETETPPDELRRERDDLHERLLRTAAEFDNYRKRTERERRELTESAAAHLIEDLLPVVDDLERALGAPAEASSAAAYRRGVELIHRRLLELLRRRGVEPIDAVGQDFDPAWHEGVANDPLGDRREGEITAEVRRGYRLGSKLLRPAMVKVASE